ncbi:MAG: N-acetylmuramoyl-L-alanine amidase [Limisphaerales bacterium]
MTLALRCGWLLALAWLGAAPRCNAAPHSAAARNDTRGSVRLQDWARAGGLDMRWLKSEQTVQLSANGVKLLLTVDSRQAELNGVQVWLCFPVTARNGGVYVARLDVEQTLAPLLMPSRDESGAKIKTVCLDPGHGCKDPGYCVGPNQEKKYALLLAEEVRDQLKRAGFKVLMTRSRDTFRELADRPGLANRRRADLFVSLHFNAVETSSQTVQGAQVFCLTPPGAASTNAGGDKGAAGSYPGNRTNSRNLLLAFQVQKALTHELGVEDRGVRRARFVVLCDASMPAILVEAGFMSHPIEGRKIFTALYRQQMAKSIVDGIEAYKRVVGGAG